MTSVNAQSTMALKALSPMPIKDSSLFSIENDDDAMSDDSFHLHLSDDEDEEKTAKNKDNPKSEGPQQELLNESEDDILNRVINKFDGTEGSSTDVAVIEQAEEDKLLDDEGEQSKKDDDKVVKDTIPPSSDEQDTKSDNSDEIKSDETTKQSACEDSGPVDDDSVNNSVNNEKEACVDGELKKESTAADEDDKTGAACDIAAGVLKAEEDAVKLEQANAEILKNQIMDTEDLLQIVEKETDENDKDSSGGNSPRSVDKGDSDELLEGDETETEKMEIEGGEAETEKMEVEGGEAEIEKMDEEEEEEIPVVKSIMKDEDAVDIDETTPFKTESDAELDKVYKSLAADEEFDSEKENSIVTDQGSCSETTETSSIDTDSSGSATESSVDKEAEVEASKDDDQTKEVVEKEADVEAPEDSKTKTSLDTENLLPDSEEQPSLPETNKADSDGDTSVKSSKRTLSESDEATSAKKMKVQTESETIPPEKSVDQNKDQDNDKQITQEREATPPPAPVKIVALNAIDEYLKIKALKKLTYKDLEQIVLQKMCEAICHKSEIGELRHQLGVQEQMVEMWRKEAAQLHKQARDLEIVNKRLLHEVRLKNERDKPLIPVKITRSVGLQVRSDANMINNVIAPKRRANRPQVTNPQSTIAPAKQNRFNAANRANTAARVSMANKVTAAPTKVTTTSRITTPSKAPIPNRVITSPVKKVMSPKTPNTLLSKALQNSAAATAAATTPANASSTTVPPTLTPITTPTLTATTTPTSTPSTTTASKTVTNVSAKPAGKPASEPKAAVIDLTDEDDKKSAPANPTQGVRIVSAPVKTVVTTAGVVNPPRIMYVYNNQLHQGVLAADPTKPGAQKLMLKLNSNVIGQANGVLAAVTNGSAIAVSNGAIRAGQVQPVRLASPLTPIRTTAMPTKTVLRHPAPLPPPPANQSSLLSRKPIPPKPHLSIKRSNGGLILSWKMPYNLDNFEAIASYQLYAYQETTSPPSSEMWRKVGDVKALALPMACTLTQFADGNKYHFAVRAVDVQKRMGPFSDPEQILL